MSGNSAKLIKLLLHRHIITTIIITTSVEIIVLLHLLEAHFLPCPLSCPSPRFGPRLLGQILLLRQLPPRVLGRVGLGRGRRNGAVFGVFGLHQVGDGVLGVGEEPIEGFAGLVEAQDFLEVEEPSSHADGEPNAPISWALRCVYLAVPIFFGSFRTRGGRICVD